MELTENVAKYLGDGVMVTRTADPYEFKIWTENGQNEIYLDMDMIELLARLVGIIRSDLDMDG